MTTSTERALRTVNAQGLDYRTPAKRIDMQILSTRAEIAISFCLGFCVAIAIWPG